MNIEIPLPRLLDIPRMSYLALACLAARRLIDVPDPSHSQLRD
jgi:hypothetical protein